MQDAFRSLPVLISCACVTWNVGTTCHMHVIQVAGLAMCMSCDNHMKGVCVCCDFFSFAADFGNRPRRLYVIINPTSGDHSGVDTWRRVEPMFNTAHIHTDYLGEEEEKEVMVDGPK